MLSTAETPQNGTHIYLIRRTYSQRSPRGDTISKNKLLQNWQPETASLLLLANKHKNINYTDKLRHTQARTLKIVPPVGDLSPDQYDCNPL